MSDIEEYSMELENEIMRDALGDENCKLLSYNIESAEPTLAEIKLLIEAHRCEITKLLQKQFTILTAWEKNQNRQALYHAQARLAYWEDILKQDKSEYDKKLHGWVMEQVDLDEKAV